MRPWLYTESLEAAVDWTCAGNPSTQAQTVDSHYHRPMLSPISVSLLDSNPREAEARGSVCESDTNINYHQP
jgi:hypothetical protein